MLTPNDGSHDGRFRAYLKKPDTWMRYDPQLFAGLSGLLGPASICDVSLIERSGLLPRATYYSAVVPDSCKERTCWREGLLDAARGADLVFLDPDNGIEVPSKPIGRKGYSKYVTWQEIRSLWETACSVLIYQHFPRECRVAFAERMTSKLRERTGVPFTAAFRTAHVLFLLAAQERHENHIRETVSLLAQQWNGQIEAMRPASY